MSNTCCRCDKPIDSRWGEFCDDCETVRRDTHKTLQALGTAHAEATERKDGRKMTTRQKYLVGCIASGGFFRNASSSWEKWEWKSFKVKFLEAGRQVLVSVVAELGMKGDEANLGCIMNRTHYHVFIGSRGGVDFTKRMFQNETKVRGRSARWEFC